MLPHSCSKSHKLRVTSHWLNLLQVFDPLANVLKVLKQGGCWTVNSSPGLDGDAARNRSSDGNRVFEGTREKPKNGVELEHPNMGAGYILPLLQHVIGGLESILDGEVNLGTCRPLAFYVFHGLMVR